MIKQNIDLEVLKSSILVLKQKYQSQTSCENRFASQNKEYVLALLKCIAQGN